MIFINTWEKHKVESKNLLENDFLLYIFKFYFFISSPLVIYLLDLCVIFFLWFYFILFWISLHLFALKCTCLKFNFKEKSQKIDFFFLFLLVLSLSVWRCYHCVGEKKRLVSTIMLKAYSILKESMKINKSKKFFFHYSPLILF